MMKKILNLLNYMETHDKDNSTPFELKELSSHLSLNEDETVKILKEAGKLGYIKKANLSSIGQEIKISSHQYYITKLGSEKIKNNLKNRFSIFVEHPIFKLVGGIIGIYTIYEIIMKIIEDLGTE